MGHAKRNKLVFTVKDKCKVCYTCVRECPVKAIKIINGQAEVLSERCIGCGNCVSVCSQDAKVYLNLKREVEFLLTDSDHKVIAMLAPSFPAEFDDIEDYRKLVGMIRQLGFYKVMDVAFGADMVAQEYKKLLEFSNNRHYISSDCPAIVFYIEHFHPELIKSLAPIVSPMVATARLARYIYGSDIKIVFIGPCVAKKAESDEVDEAITFKELKELFAKQNINQKDALRSEFDGPQAGMGAIFPLERGLLQNVDKSDNIVEGKIIVDSGKNNFKEAIKEFEKGEIADYHLELLCCQGCIQGPGMTEKNRHFHKRSEISKYVKEKMKSLDVAKWKNDIDLYKNISLAQTFNPMDRRVSLPGKTEIEKVLAKMGKEKLSDHLNCGACGYDTCFDHATAVLQGYAEEEMCLPYSIEKLHKSINELNLSKEKLINTRLALKQSEKLANMGQISAGIAHEVNNPLGVITMYSNIILDELSPDDPHRADVELIVEQANRCKNIVGGLLNFARKNKVKTSEVDIEAFLTHGMNSIIFPANVTCSVTSSLKDNMVMIDESQMMQAIVNIVKNAVDALPDGGEIKVLVDGNEKNFEIRIQDNGTGIAEENMDKLFTPFFTTKEIGKGTGLGLPLVYGIIKMHSGKIDVKSNNKPELGKTGTEFIISLPRVN